LGVKKVRLTGGEPLVRRDLPTLVRLLAQKPLEELALTTNGVLLGAQAQALKDAGLTRLTVSLDTLEPARFLKLTRRDCHASVLEGLREAKRVGLGAGLKLDAVVMKGVNDDELVALLDFAAQLEAELRFIEYMDVGGATHWSAERVVTREALLAELGAKFGPVTALPRGTAPAERFRLPSGQIFGIIASTTQPFCGSCDRARLTADGRFFTCLYGTEGLDLKGMLRAGASAAEVEAALTARWKAREDRGAEARLALHQLRGPSASRQTLKDDPHLEMHTRGG
jgi:cyclic pyranopterin phosphate synthase